MTTILHIFSHSFSWMKNALFWSIYWHIKGIIWLQWVKVVSAHHPNFGNDFVKRNFHFIFLNENSIIMIVFDVLTHWGWVMHICVGNLTIVDSDNGLSPGRRQAVIWTNAGILLMEPFRTKLGEIVIEILTFSFKKMHLIVSSAKWRPFCPGGDALIRSQHLYSLVPRTLLLYI